MKAFLKNIDLFGVHLQNRVEKNSDSYRSEIGGVISFIIFSASISYAIWIGYLWNTHQFSAKISSSLYASDHTLLNLNYDVLKITFWNEQQGKFDPFKERILVPLVSYTYNYTIEETFLLEVSNETAESGTNYIIPKVQLGFTNINGSIFESSEMYIRIVKCTQNLLPEGEECANEETINEFFNQPKNYVIMEVHYRQLDSKDGAIQSSVQEFLVQLDDLTCSTLTIYLQTTLYEVKKSLLFGEPEYYEFINGATVLSQTNSLKYCQISYDQETYMLFFIEMKGNQTKTTFEYPSAGDLLANIGSIISVLFTIKHIIFIINKEYMNKKLIDDVICFYYPQFKKIRIIKNWKFQISKIHFNNQPVDISGFQDFYKRIYQQILQQFTLKNTIYELSRLQIVLRQLVTADDLRSSHHYSLSFDHLILQKSNSPGAVEIIEPHTPTNQKAAFLEQDVNLLNLEQREQENQFITKQVFTNR